MWYKVIIFLVVNFAALGIGGFATGDGVSSQWYAELSKAPWTPPGWVFGAAWTTIMICFSIYMAYLFKFFKDPKLSVLFGIQFVLNVIWNYIFFNQHLIGIGLIVIVILTIIVGAFLTSYHNKLKIKSLLIVPYLLWLLIATSLNAYIYLYN